MVIRRIISAVLALSFTFLLINCSTTESDNLSFATGTVKYINLEGGFWGIISDDNKHYDPVNLPKEFQVDGKRITFKYRLAKDQVSFHMWGTIVEVFEVKPL